MQIRSSTLSQNYQHPEFLLSWSDPAVPDQDGHALLYWLEERARSGVSFSDGQTVQIGWMVTRVHRVDANTLELQEPDFQSFPVRWESSLDHCLRDMRRQRDVLASFEPQPPPSFPSVMQAAYVCANYAAGKFPPVIERGPAKDRFSGWYITCDDPNDQHDLKDLKLVSLYEVAMRMPGLVQFLVLPTNCAGRVSATEVDIYWGEQQLKVKRDSYLDRLLIDRQASQLKQG